MSNDVEVIIRTKDESKSGFDSSAKAAKNYGNAIDSVGEKADASEQRILGAKDAVDGVATIMQGPGEQGMAAYLQGWADLASGIANFIIPLVKSTAGIVANGVATGAAKTAQVAAAGASKAWAAAQWLLNAALTANPIGLVIVGIGALVAALVLAYKHSETFRNAVNGVFGGLRDFVLPILKVIWDAVVATFEGFVGSVQKVISVIPGASSLLNKLAGDSKQAATNIADTGAAAETYEEQQKRLNTEIDNATKELDGYIDSLNEASGVFISAEDAAINYEEAIDSATAAIKENGKTHDKSTAAGRANEKSLLAVAKASNDEAAANIRNGVSLDTVSTKANTNRTNFIKLATQMGYSRKEAEALAQKMLSIPNVSRSVTIKYTSTGVNLTTPSSVGRNAHGGIFGGGMTWVGEDGPELADLPAGTQIHSNANSTMKTRSGSSAAVVQLEFKSGGSAFDDLIIELLRKYVRVVGGGNVQLALGR